MKGDPRRLSMADLPDFPLFEVSDADRAFGCHLGRYVGKRKGAELSRALQSQSRVAQKLFFDGGVLADHGLRVRDGLDVTQVHRAIGALLKSFATSHEGKIGTVALALHHWCEPVNDPTGEGVSK
jgi:hypothetical protein